MSNDWQGVVTDPIDRRVFEALADKRWEFRTVEGLAESTGLSQSRIRETLTRYSDLVRRSTVRDEKGRELYTLRPPTTMEQLALVRAFAAKST
jgi:hypothetical protein